MITARTRVFGLIGHPVRRSLSPAMYNELLRRYGIDAVYLAFDVDPRDAGRVGDAIRTLDLSGVNLTVPFKERVLPDLDRLTLAAEEAGAVNVVVQEGGQLSGYNTDGEGLMRSLDEAGVPLPGTRAVVLGTGGAGRAVASALLDRRAGHVTVLNRTLSRAEGIAQALEARFHGAGLEAAELTVAAFQRLAAGADLVVNCTAGEAAPLISAMDAAVLAPDATWVDINYWMDTPPQQRRCAELGLRFENGMGMLVHQGALAFELFTGHPVEGATLLEIIEAGGGEEGP